MEFLTGSNKTLNGIIWAESFWLPSELHLTWKDLENEPGSSTYYPQVEHLHWALPLSLVLLVIRYVWELFVIVPIGIRLGLSNTKRQRVTSVPQLEKVYKKNKKPDHGSILALSKQTDLTERQVEIWFRKRSKQDVLTPMQKFRECSWHLVFYTTFFIYGLVVLWNKPYTWKTVLCWDGWPKQHVTDDIYWYYVVELSFYWGLMFTVLKDNKRKDFREMMVHHFATIVLVYFSWIMNFVRIGSLVLIVHDAADTWLALAKMSIYLKKKTATDIFFGIFLVVWIVSRLIIYPFVCLYCTTVEPYTAKIMTKTFGSHQFFNFFLYVLQVLHIIWSYLIFRIIYRKVKMGNLLIEVLEGISVEERINLFRNKRAFLLLLTRLLYCTLFEPFQYISSVFGAYVFFNIFLGLIFVLNAVWSYYIGLIAYNSIVKKDVEDVRSDSEAEDEDDELEDKDDELNDAKTSVANGTVNGSLVDDARRETRSNGPVKDDLQGVTNGFTVSKAVVDSARAEVDGARGEENGVGNGGMTEDGRSERRNGRPISPSKIPRVRRN